MAIMAMDGNTNELALMKFGVGQAVPRKEDPTLLRGEGRYTDDLSLPGQAYAVMVRSGYAHGFIRGIDAAAARGMPGVLGVYTAADLEAAGSVWLAQHAGPLESAGRSPPAASSASSSTA